MFYKRIPRFTISLAHPANPSNSLGFISELGGFPGFVPQAPGNLTETKFAIFYKRIGWFPHPVDRIPGDVIRYVLQANLTFSSRLADLQKLQIR